MVQVSGMILRFPRISGSGLGLSFLGFVSMSLSQNSNFLLDPPATRLHEAGREVARSMNLRTLSESCEMADVQLLN
jgi:hypothetical protein